MKAKSLSITGSSFLVPANRSWADLSDLYELKFGEYGEWSAAVSGAATTDIVVAVVILDDIIRSQGMDDESIKVICESIFRLISSRLERSNGVTIVAILSGEAHSAVRNAKIMTQRYRIHHWMVERLQSLADQFPHLYIMNLDAVFSSIGLEKALDSRNWYFAHCRLSSMGIRLLSSSIEQILYRDLNPPSKVLVLDCDNTIWGGVVGEDGLEEIQIGQDGVGKAFQEFQHVAKNLASEGVILALASKNNEQEVWNIFDNHSAMVLQKSDIVAWKIDWREKAQNIELLSKELDLGLDSFVFWDDNPMERDKVKKALPEVYTVDIPTNEHDWPKYLENLACFAKFRVTEDDTKKTKQYHTRANFVRDSIGVEDDEVYLKSIKLKATAIPIGPSNISRAVQLCAKTNQYNLRTIRHDQDGIEKLAQVNSDFCFLVGLEDVYGDHGIVGLVCLAPINSEILMLDTLLMSCRVLGRHLESWMMTEAIERARAQGFSIVVGQFVESKRNIIASEFFSSQGFEPLELCKEFIDCDAVLATIQGSGQHGILIEKFMTPWAKLYEKN